MPTHSKVKNTEQGIFDKINAAKKEKTLPARTNVNEQMNSNGLSNEFDFCAFIVDWTI